MSHNHRKEQIEIPSDLLTLKEEKQVVVHFKISKFSVFRIDPTTYLQCTKTGQKSQLTHSLNLLPYPRWSHVKGGSAFTLIFEGFKNDCSSFNLIEDKKDEKATFNYWHISRNAEDVYKLIW